MNEVFYSASEAVSLNSVCAVAALDANVAAIAIVTIEKIRYSDLITSLLAVSGFDLIRACYFILLLGSVLIQLI